MMIVDKFISYEIHVNMDGKKASDDTQFFIKKTR